MKHLEISNLSTNEDSIILHISESLLKNEALSLQAAGRMLADSEQLALIYLLEDEESYRHVSIPEHLWAELHSHLKEKENVYIQLHQDYVLECTSFKDEINYLFENIQDNSNYGDKMVEAVERIISQ
ncbi:UPF0738 family protein [Alkalihalobacterium elongatum]|uniref:UPF0738 family protein n=1 Tax=Alkalihalobacterium elongatum TaxID=2675466 RepID=UPI001C1F6BFC|nr:hypothetical protein [Alkalihalobacterium elongatum]